MKLGLKLAIVLIVVSIVSSFMAGFFAYRSSRQAIERIALSHLTSTTILKEAEFRRWIAQNTALIEALARRPLVRKYAASLVFDTDRSADLINAHQVLLEDHFKPEIKEKGGFTALSILNKDDGLILVSTEPALEEKQREREPFFLEGRAGTYVGNVEYSLSMESPVMHISTAIRDADREIVAVLAGHLDWREMSEIMRQGSVLTETEETYLVNRYNFFVTENRFRPDSFMREAAHTEGVKDCLSGNNGIGLYDDYRGVPVFGSYRWIGDHELCIVTEIDQAEALLPVRKLQKRIFSISAVVAFAAVMLGMAFSRSIAERIRMLAAGAREIGKGNLNYRLAAKGTDEIDRLSQSFNQMAADLQSITVSHAELQAEVIEREKAEAALREERDRAQQYLDIAGVAILALNDREEISLINRRGCDLLGYSQEEIIGQNWFGRFVPEHQREAVRGIFRGIMKGHSTAADYYENRVLTRNGADRLLAWHNTVIKDGSGKIIGTLSSGEDITDRRQAENKLRESEKRLEKVLFNMPVMLDAFDESMNICLWNRQCEIVTGFSADEIVGNPEALGMLYPDSEYRNHMMAEWAARPDDYINWEWGITCKNGDKKTIAWSNISARVPIPDWKSWGIGVDVTERNRAIEAVEKSLKEKEILLQEIHHRVKNNMQVIVSLLKLQAAQISEKPYIELVTEIQNRIKSMAIVHERLYQTDDVSNIDLKKYAQAVCQSLFRSFGIRQDKIRLRIEIDDIAMGMGAAVACGLIINELVSNSLKYAFPDGSNGRINLTVRQTDDRRIELRLEDNGVGLPADFDIRTADSLGLRLIVMLAEDQLEGSVRFVNANGLKCVLAFPGRLASDRGQLNG